MPPRVAGPRPTIGAPEVTESSETIAPFGHVPGDGGPDRAGVEAPVGAARAAAAAGAGPRRRAQGVGQGGEAGDGVLGALGQGQVSQPSGTSTLGRFG